MREKLIIFDLDGTILRLEISTRQFERVKELITAYFRQYALHDTFKPILPKIRLLAKRATSDLYLQGKIVRECYKIVEQAELAPDGGVGTKPENTELVLGLVSNGIKVGIISNNGREAVLGALQEAGLDKKVFQFIVTRDDIENPKPFIDPYLAVKEYFDTYHVYFFSDDVFDFLAPMYLEKQYSWEIDKYIVFDMDITNQSYEWNTLTKMDFSKISRDS